MSKPIEWKKQDKVFCVLPFISHLVSTQGWTELCCDSDTNARTYESPDKSDWHASHIKQARELFNEGKWPSECSRCHTTEKQGGRSLRQNSNRLWLKEYQHFRDNPTTTPPLPISYDLRLGNYCNLECIMCDPESSSKIGGSLNKYFGKTEYSRTDDKAERTMIDNILKDPSRIQKIYLSGGEPFIMPGAIHLLNNLCDSGHSKHINLHVSTNGTVMRTDWVDKWLTKFKSVFIAISLDAIGDRAEYVRFGHKWETLNRRIRNMAEAVKDHYSINLHVGATVHAATVTQIIPLYEWAQELKLSMDYHCVNSPKWLRPERVPDHIKKPVIEWIDSQSKLKMDAFRLTTIKAQLKQPQKHSNSDYHSQHEYIRFLNATYPVKWKDAVPELKDWDQS